MTALHPFGQDKPQAARAQLPVRARMRSVAALAAETDRAEASRDHPGARSPNLPAAPFVARGPRETALQRRLRRLVWALPMTTGLWLVLTGGDYDSLALGIPAVALACALAVATTPATRWRLSLPGALRFALWFAWQSVLGASDVARRAFSPRMKLAPGFYRYAMRLPQGAPRIFFANAVSLLPGTLSAELEGGDVVVHSLDRRLDTHAELAVLELRVAALFDLLPRSDAPTDDAGKPALAGGEA